MLHFANARIVDGTGRPPFPGDVLVTGDRIGAVGERLDPAGARTVDVRGLTLAPGFIDVHSHSDISLLRLPAPIGKTLQGVTTEINGNCAFSPFPLRDDPEFIRRRRSSLSFIDVPGVDWEWRDYRGYVERLAASGPNTNSAELIGHGSIRAVVMGYEDRRPSAAELAAMRRILAEAFEAGAKGLSTGLGYAPDFYADTDELIAMGEVVRQYDRMFTFHIRGERATLFKAAAEVVRVSRESGARAEISHLKCAGRHNHGRGGELLALIEEGVAHGADVTFDMYPYLAGSSYLGLVFPPWAHEGGLDGLLGRLADPAARGRIVADMMEGVPGWSPLVGEEDGANLVITAAPGQVEAVGKSLRDIGLAWSMRPAEAAVRLMREEKGGVEMVLHLVREDDMDAVALHPLCLYGTDGLGLDPGEHALRVMPHPRYYGSMPTLFQRYVKTGRLPLEELVHRLTRKAAQRFGLVDRGRIAPGQFADIVVFDPDAFACAASYEKPHQPATGVEHLLVNGGFAVENGIPVTERRFGRVL